MNIKDFLENTSITFEQKFSDLWLELERIDSELWDCLDDQEQYLNDDNLPREKADVHYFEGKREGFEAALAVFYNEDDVEKIYEHEPDNT